MPEETNVPSTKGTHVEARSEGTATNGGPQEAPTASPSFRPTRRSFLQGVSAAGAVAAFSGYVPSFASSGGPAFDPKLFLLDRLTFGWDEGSTVQGQATWSATFDSEGYDGCLDLLLEVVSPPASVLQDSAFFGYLEQFHPISFDFFKKTPAEILTTTGGGNIGGATHSARIPLLLNAFSARQGRARTADFWASVHNVFARHIVAWPHWWPLYRDTLFDRGLGKYVEPTTSSSQPLMTGGLLPHSARSGAMLTYLDQWRSTATAPIENYARELVELHTVGLNGLGGTSTYDQGDVEQIAELLTGWSMSAQPLGDFLFDATKHTQGAQFLKFLKIINGQTGEYSHFPPLPAGTAPGSSPNPPPMNSGISNRHDGERLLLELGLHPLTALHMSERLINWFLGDFTWNDDCSPYFQLWGQVAVSYLMHSGDIAQTLRYMFDANQHQLSRPSAYQKVRRPMDMLVAFLRATGAKTTDADLGWMAELISMENLPGHHPAPDGYSPSNEAWTASLVSRFNLMHRLAYNELSGVFLDDTQVGALLPATSAPTLANQANYTLLGGGLTGNEVMAIETYLNSLQGASVETLRREALAMTFSSPSFQFYH